jgi:hypothetical protein
MAGNPRDWAPTPGSNWWDEDDKAYDRAVRRQQKERGVPFRRRSRRRPLWTWALPPIAVLGFLTAAAVAMGSPDDDGDGVSLQTATSLSAPSPSTTESLPPDVTTTAPPAASIPESISDNSTNPPQADLNGDTECVLGSLGWVTAQGTLTNHSSETSSYMIHVSFNDEAGVRFAEAPTVHNDVRAGETVRWDATTPQGAPAGSWTCEVVSIERFASQ